MKRYKVTHIITSEIEVESDSEYQPATEALQKALDYDNNYNWTQDKSKYIVEEL